MALPRGISVNNERRGRKNKRINHDILKSKGLLEMEESAVAVILSGIMWVALLKSIANDRKRDRREYQERLERERRWKEQQALHARTAKLINIHPINRAALRWIKEAELDACSKNPDEVNWANSELYVVKYLCWSIDRLKKQGFLDDDMASDMEFALQCISDGIDRDNLELQTQYFLAHSVENGLQLAKRLRKAENLDQSARVIVKMFEGVILNNPNLLHDPDED